MRYLTEELHVPNFTRLRNGDGYCDGYATRLLRKLFFVTIYPDGNAPKNKGQVSIVFEYFDISNPDKSRPRLTSCHFTVSVVEANGDSRFPQSHAIGRDEIRIGHCTTMERFIRRQVLLDSREDLLLGDTLTLRFETVSIYEEVQTKEEWQQLHRQLYKIAKEESWFVLFFGFDLRNPDSPLCTRLREKSEFFEFLFQTPSKREEDLYVRNEVEEFDAFFDMLCYVRFQNLRHIVFDRQYCDLYRVADKYGVVELQEICRSHIKQNLSWSFAINVLCTANLCDDADLRAEAFRLALHHWKDVRKEYEKLTDVEKRMKFMRELKCAVNILNSENETSADGAAAGQVLQNREELQNSLTWKIFASEMTDLAKEILSWSSDEYMLGEKYKEQKASYDFYK